MGDLFEIKGNPQLNKDSFVFSEDSKYPYFTRTEFNNGVLGYVDYLDDEHKIDGGCLAVGMIAMKFFYMEKDFYAGQFTKRAIPKSFTLTPRIATYFISLLNKNQRTFQSVLVRNFETEFNKTKVQLPTKNGEIDFAFMDDFIAELEAERIAELEAYLLASGLKNYTLTKEEEKVLAEFKSEKVEWSEFAIGSIFRKLNLRTHKKPFDKLSDTSTVPTDEFNLPLVNAKLGDNGIMFYGREKDFDSAEMTVDIISNGAVATGTVYAQPYKVGVLWDAYLLKPQDVDATKQKLLFFTTALEKSIKLKFGWDNKAVWSKVQKELFSLPTQNNQPNYAKMETFISAIQKLVIKDVVLYADRKIATTKEVVGGK